MDLNTRSTEELSRTGVKMPLIDDDTGEVLSHKAKGDKAPREMFLTLLGPDSDEVQIAAAQYTNRMNRKKGDKLSIDKHEIEANRRAEANIVAGITLDGLVFVDGAWLKITKDNAFDFYYRFAEFRNKAIAFGFAAKNFRKG